MGALQPFHLIVILIVVLIVFGPGKLTDLGSQLGRGMREFRQISEGGTDATAKDAPQTGFCDQCGAALPAGAQFCTTCGHAISRAEASGKS